MMKVAGALLILGTTTIWGIKKAEKYKSKLEHMKYLQRILTLIQSEIRYSRSFMGEIFGGVGQNAKEPYRSWLLHMSKRLEEFTGESFEHIWRSSIDKYLNVLELPTDEMDRFKVLGNQLGFSDIQVQMRLIDLYQEQLERTIGEMQEQMQTKVRLCHCMGVMSGLFIAVLLF